MLISRVLTCLQFSICFFSPSTVFLTTARHVGHVTRPLSWISSDHRSSILPVRTAASECNCKHSIFFFPSTCTMNPRTKKVTRHQTRVQPHFNRLSSFSALNVSVTQTQHCFGEVISQMLFNPTSPLGKVFSYLFSRGFFLLSFLLHNYFRMQSKLLFWQEGFHSRSSHGCD